MTLKDETFRALKCIKNENKTDEEYLEWTIREKLALASAVFETGEEYWPSISRMIQPFGADNRTNNSWCSQKECAKQYSMLIDNVGKIKRNENNNSNVPMKEQIVKKLTVERMQELHDELNSETDKQNALLQLREKIETGEIDDQVDAIWDQLKEDEDFVVFLSDTSKKKRVEVNESETTEAMMCGPTKDVKTEEGNSRPVKQKKPRILLHLRKSSSSPPHKRERSERTYREDDTSDMESNMSDITDPAIDDSPPVLSRHENAVLILTPSSTWLKRSLTIINEVIDDANAHLFDTNLLVKKEPTYNKLFKKWHTYHTSSYAKSLFNKNVSCISDKAANLRTLLSVINITDMRSRLRNNQYESPSEFESDLLTVILNSLFFYPINSPSHRIVKYLYERIASLFPCLYEETDFNNTNCDTVSTRRSSRQKMTL